MGDAKGTTKLTRSIHLSKIDSYFLKDTTYKFECSKIIKKSSGIPKYLHIQRHKTYM